MRERGRGRGGGFDTRFEARTRATTPGCDLTRARIAYTYVTRYTSLFTFLPGVIQQARPAIRAFDFFFPRRRPMADPTQAVGEITARDSRLRLQAAIYANLGERDSTHTRVREHVCRLADSICSLAAYGRTDGISIFLGSN